MCSYAVCTAHIRRAPSSHVVWPDLALREFAPSYQRATIVQVCLAMGGLAFGLTAAWRLHDPWVAIGAILLRAQFCLR
jgi:hypothetical protein